MRKRTLLLTCAALIGLMLAFQFGRTRLRQRNVSPTGAELIFYCGAGLRPAADELIARFDARMGIRITATYAGSGRLLGQIATLERGDLFMPGAAFYLDKAVEKSLIVPESRRTVAFFVPVLFVRKGNPKNIRGLSDLTRPGLRIGLGDERSCAVGKQALKILARNAIDYAAVEPNIAYKSGTVDELGVAISLETIDVAVMWDANASYFGDAGDIVPIPRENNIISEIPIAILSSSVHRDEARRFVDFVTSDEGRQVFGARGYTVILPKKRNEL
jgi:molybdate transport system substrate-binding protein